MLRKVNVTTMEHGNKFSDIPSAGREYVLATEAINGVQASGNGSSFYFTENLYSPRESPYYMVSDDTTPAELVTTSNLSWANNLMYMEIFTDNDPTKAIIERYVNINSIRIAWTYELDSDYCWVVYWVGAFVRKQVLCAFNLDALVQYADTSTTTA